MKTQNKCCTTEDNRYDQKCACCIDKYEKDLSEVALWTPDAEQLEIIYIVCLMSNCNPCSTHYHQWFSITRGSVVSIR